MAMQNERGYQPVHNHVGVVVIHGVADAEQGANLDTLVRTIVAAESATKFSADDYDQVHRFAEPFATPGAPAERPVVFRHAMVGATRSVTFAEMYWADTTRVGAGKLAALLAAFRLVFEAHYFIEALVPREGRSWLAGRLVSVLYFATALIRGPIAAVNVLFLSVAAIYLYGQAVRRLAQTDEFARTYPDFKVMSLEWAVFWICAAIVAAAVYVFCKSRRRGDLASMEGGLWTIFVAFAGMTVLGCAILFAPRLVPEDAAAYAEIMFAVILSCWAVFVLIWMIAFVIVLLLTASPRYPHRKRSLWVALSLVLLQSILWAFFMSVWGVPLLGWAKLTLPHEIPAAQEAMLGFARATIALLAVLMSALFVMLWRGWTASDARQESDAARQEGLRRIAEKMPRLIMSPIIMAVILAAGLASMAVATFKIDQPLLGGNIYLSLTVVVIITVITLALYLAIDTRASLNFIHIARDLIDHHYKPELSFAYWWLPRERKDAPTYPRRQRLLSRVESTVNFFKEQGCSAFVFVAHSQGTIIVFEYLAELLDRNSRMPGPTAVVTFGSPLEHLYTHYFHAYANVGAKLGELRRLGVASWTNLYRVDDPIGNRIEDPAHWLTNVAMERGGHTNYWKERVVAEVINAAVVPDSVLVYGTNAR
jgi:hypothetical protein